MSWDLKIMLLLERTSLDTLGQLFEKTDYWEYYSLNQGKTVNLER